MSGVLAGALPVALGEEPARRRDAPSAGPAGGQLLEHLVGHGEVPWPVPTAGRA